VRSFLVWAVLAASSALVVACGGADRGFDRRASATVTGDNGQPARWVKQTAQPRADAPENLIVFRRIRYEGATMRTLYLHHDGTMQVEVPGGGTGASRFDGRVTAGTLRDVRALVRRIDWRHPSPHKVEFDGSGAYYMLRHGEDEQVAMASGMSKDLIGVVRRLNGVLNGEGVASKRPVHRFNIP
jgi:hypothetical protein